MELWCLPIEASYFLDEYYWTRITNWSRIGLECLGAQRLEDECGEHMRCTALKEYRVFELGN